MPKKSFSSLPDQVTDLLRQGMTEGRWHGTLPGRDRLARELGCSHGTMEEAMQKLSREGLLVSQGTGRPRKIVLSGEVKRARGFRVSVLCYEKSDRESNYFLNYLINQLQEAGHDASFASKAMHELGMDAERIARYAKKTDTEAWVVVAGSREVLEWFAEQPVPAFALFAGAELPTLAGIGVNKNDVHRELIDKFYDLGHRRIVMLVREERRKPTPGFTEKLFLKQLEEKGIQTSEYNLPDWGDHPESLCLAIDSLFQYTPPTAIIVDEPATLMAVLQHLGRLGIRAPEQLSLVCMDDSPVFDWCFPAITHITWDPNSLVKRVVKWADNVSLGKEDRRKTVSNAQLVLGGTIGPAPR